jgi:4a-hydroxytetrahydrobiopterin dehydratase
MSYIILNEDELLKTSYHLKGWQVTPNSLQKEYRMRKFLDAILMINDIAALAESHNHHPEIWNRYHRLQITLTTHDANNRVTTLDVKLAEEIDMVFDKIMSQSV